MATTYRVIGSDDSHAEKPADVKEVYDSSRLSFEDAVKEFSTRKDTELTFSLYKQTAMRFDILIRADVSAPVVVDDKSYALIFGDRACEIVIKDTDMAAYRTYLEALSKASNLSEKEYLKRTGIFIKENSKMLMKDLLRDPRSGEKIKEAGAVVSGMTDSIIENRDMIYNMAISGN
jgi:hypothetical protein